MPIFIHPLAESSLQVLVEQLKREKSSNAWVLVSGVGDQRLARRALQSSFAGLAPPVEVLNRQLAAWLKFGAPEQHQVLFLNRKERRLAIEEWRSSRNLDEVWVDRIDRLIAYLYRSGINPLEVPPSFGVHGMHMREFVEWCKAKGWHDRASLFLLAETVPVEALGMESIHLFLTNPLIPYEEKALNALMHLSQETVDWHVYRPQGTSSGLVDDIGEDPPQISVLVHFMEAHHLRGELEAVFGKIKSRVAESEEHELGAKFSDYVIISADYANHQALLPVMESRFEVPVSPTRGPSIIGDPALARLRSFLQLSKNGFPIDDIVDVFADQVIPLPGYDQNENQSPNLRTFSRLCRRYNIRDLKQACEELERAIARESEREAQRRARMNATGGREDVHPPEFDVRHGPFYRDVLQTLVALQENYPTGPLSLADWFIWAEGLLESLGTLPDQAFMSALNVLQRKVKQGLGMTDRLKTNPQLNADGFFEWLDSLLDGNIPVADHPGKVMVAALEDVRCTEGKIVFVVGLSDDRFPLAFSAEDQFPGLPIRALRWLADRQMDANIGARDYLDTVARFSSEIYLSWPKSRGGKGLMASALLMDYPYHFPHWEKTEWDPEEPEACLDQLDYTLKAAQIPLEIDNAVDFEDAAQRARLAAYVAIERRNPRRIGPWEGQLSAADEEWQPLVRALLVDQMGDGRLRMSVSRLDEYAASPLEYFFKRILRLDVPEEYSEEAEQNQKGDLLHAILENFYSNSERFGPPIDPKLDFDSARSRLMAIAEQIFVDRVEDLGYPDTPYPEILKQRILLTLNVFLQLELKGLLEYDELPTLKPAALWSASEKGTEVAFDFEMTVDGEPITLNGFVDRIDRDEADEIRLVMDYKTGGTTSLKEFDKHMKKGLSFQLPLYLKAMSIDQDRRLLAGYYHLSIDKAGDKAMMKSLLGDKDMIVINRSKKDFNGLLDPEIRRRFIDAVLDRRVVPIVRAIRQGRFHQSLTSPSKYSDFKYMSRWSEAVSTLRNLTISRELSSDEEIFGSYYVEREVMREEEFKPEDTAS